MVSLFVSAFISDFEVNDAGKTLTPVRNQMQEAVGCKGF